jgi:hypothetical protein
MLQMCARSGHTGKEGGVGVTWYREEDDFLIGPFLPRGVRDGDATGGDCGVFFLVGNIPGGNQRCFGGDSKC